MISLYILDTDTLTLAERGHRDVIRRIQSMAPCDLAITVISIEEQLTGRYLQIHETDPSRLQSARRPGGSLARTPALRQRPVRPPSSQSRDPTNRGRMMNFHRLLLLADRLFQGRHSLFERCSGHWPFSSAAQRPNQVTAEPGGRRSCLVCSFWVHTLAAAIAAVQCSTSSGDIEPRGLSRASW